jgi:hypothetical protein
MRIQHTTSSTNNELHSPGDMKYDSILNTVAMYNGVEWVTISDLHTTKDRWKWLCSIGLPESGFILDRSWFSENINILKWIIEHDGKFDHQAHIFTLPDAHVKLLFELRWK